MTEFDLGDVPTATVQFRNESDDPGDPDVVTLEMLRPDGTAFTVEEADMIHVAASGLYGYRLELDQPGRWSGEWHGTGAITATERFDYFVRDSVVTGAGLRYTYDPATLVGQVRLLTDDRDLSGVAVTTPIEQRSAVWADEELQVFLDANGDSALLAAAQALTVLAANRQLLVQSRRIGQTTVSFGAVRSDLLAQAKAYREMALTADGPALEHAEIAYNDFGARRIITNDMLRNG